jgi:hypothetical protein
VPFAHVAALEGGKGVCSGRTVGAFDVVEPREREGARECFELAFSLERDLDAEREWDVECECEWRSFGAESTRLTVSRMWRIVFAPSMTLPTDERRRRPSDPETFEERERLGERLALVFAAGVMVDGARQLVGGASSIFMPLLALLALEAVEPAMGDMPMPESREPRLERERVGLMVDA